MKRTVTMLACLAVFFYGCSKKEAPATTATISSDSLIYTPFGVRPQSQVHHIDEGFGLTYQGDHLVKINLKTRLLAEDFGVQRKIGEGADLLRKARAVTLMGSGWITYAQTLSAFVLSSMRTTFTVPPNPPTYHNQLLYIFAGLVDDGSDDSHILQPVLQFGTNGVWGGHYWSINNWYAGCQGCAVFYGTPLNVNPGTVLVGAMSQRLPNDTATAYEVKSAFYYHRSATDTVLRTYADGNAITVGNAKPLRYVYQALEAYRVQAASDYPDGFCAMRNIELRKYNGFGLPDTAFVPEWLGTNAITDAGQHTVVVSPSEVDLYFH